MRTPEGGTLIADTGNHRVIEVDEAGAVVWQYGNTANRLGGNQGSGPNQLSEPAWAARLPNGHTLIADTGNGRVIELDAQKALLWQYRAGAARGGTPVKDPCGATRLANGNTLVLGRQGAVEVDPDLTIVWEHHLAPREGTAPLSAVVPSAHPAYQPILNPEALVPLVEPAKKPEPAIAAPDHRGSELPANLPDAVLLADRTGGRVLEIDRKMQIFWQFSGIVGGGGNRLLAPNYVTRLPNGGTLVADTGNHRVVEVRDQSIVWQFGKPGEAGAGPKHLSQPRSVERTPQGTMLIADFGNRRVVEVTVAGDVRWGREGFKGPAYASRLPSGNTLVCDWADHQVLEIDPKGSVVWSFGQSGYGGPGANQLYHPEHAVRLENGNTLIADTQNHRVIEVSPAREIVWQYGGEPAFLGRKGRFGIQLNTPIVAWRLSEGTTLVVHAGKNHIVELDPELNILWHFTLAQDRR
ncbi:NHL repeat protein [compost metagenome]